MSIRTAVKVAKYNYTELMDMRLGAHFRAINHIEHAQALGNIAGKVSTTAVFPLEKVIKMRNEGQGFMLQARK